MQMRNAMLAVLSLNWFSSFGPLLSRAPELAPLKSKWLMRAPRMPSKRSSKVSLASAQVSGVWQAKEPASFQSGASSLGKPPQSHGHCLFWGTWRQSRPSTPLPPAGPGRKACTWYCLSTLCVGVWLVLSDLKLVSDVAKFLSGQVETNWFTSVIVSDKSAVALNAAAARLFKWEETLLLLAFLWNGMIFRLLTHLCPKETGQGWPVIVTCC